MSNVAELLGDKAEYLLGFNTPKIAEGAAASAGTGLGRSDVHQFRSEQSRAGQPGVDVSATAAWAARAICRSCRSIRASSTAAARRSPRIPITSIPRTS